MEPEPYLTEAARVAMALADRGWPVPFSIDRQARKDMVRTLRRIAADPDLPADIRRQASELLTKE